MILTNEQVLQKYAPMVFKIAYARLGNKYDADDIMQEVFLRYIKAKTDFQSEEHIRNWLIRAAVNCSKSLLSSSWHQKTAPMDEALATTDETDEVTGALMSLSEVYRTVIHLHYYEGFSVAEIASLLGRSEGTVKSQLFRGRDALRKQLEGDEE